MRLLLARWMAILTGLLVCLMAVLFALVQNPLTLPSDFPVFFQKNGTAMEPGTPSELNREKLDIHLGRTLYMTLKCWTCHSVEGEGNPYNPLDGIGSTLEAEEIRRWILFPKDMDPDLMKPDYSYLTGNQVDLLVKYLLSLK